MDVGQNTTLCDCDMSQKLVQFLIVADRELEMTGDDTCLFVVASSVSGQLEDFRSEVLKHSCKIYGST